MSAGTRDAYRDGGGIEEVPRIVTVMSVAAFVLFVASLVALVTASTLSVSLTVLYVSLGVFAACSLAWTVLQLLYGSTASLRLVVGTGIVLVVAGLTVLAVYIWGTPADALPLIGAILFYVGLGWLVEALRRARHLNALPGAIVLGVGVVVVVVATLLLSHSAGGGYVALLVVIGVAMLLMIPIGLNLTSESALRALAPTRRGSLIIAAGGALLIVAVVLTAGLVGHAWLAVGFAAAAGLALMLAFVSDTHADIAIALGALAVLAAAPPEHPTPDTIDAGQGTSVLVALGDSYMSGEGASSFFAGTDDGGRDECRRTPSAYAVLATGPGKRFDQLTFLACSGARTYNVIAAADDTDASVQPGEGATQVDQLKQIRAKDPSFHPKIVIISVGGNDAGFATLGELCLAPGNCDSQRGLFTRNLRKVRTALIDTYASIRAALPDVPIVAVPYPQPLADSASCGAAPFALSERVFIRSFVTELNETVKSAAQQEHVYYMDTMPNALADAHLQLCDRARHGDPGINTVSLESVSGLAAQRFSPLKWLHNSLHPNERGHKAMLRAFDLWLSSHPTLTRRFHGDGAVINGKVLQAIENHGCRDHDRVERGAPSG